MLEEVCSTDIQNMQIGLSGKVGQGFRRVKANLIETKSYGILTRCTLRECFILYVKLKGKKNRLEKVGVLGRIRGGNGQVMFLKKCPDPKRHCPFPPQMPLSYSSLFIAQDSSIYGILCLHRARVSVYILGVAYLRKNK